MLRTLSAIILLPALGLLGWLALQETSPRADFVVASDELRFLDPARVSHQHEIQVARALFEGLTRLNDESLIPEPGLAERWEVDATQTHYTFHLRDGIRWSNGEPITAEHFRWSWLRAMLPSTRSQYITFLYVIDGAEAYSKSRRDNDSADDLPESSVGIEALDERTLRVRLAQPCSYFLDLAAFPTLCPVYPPSLAGDAVGKWNDPAWVVCSGAFTLERWDFKRRLLLRKNPRYWDAASIGVDSIEMLIAIDPSTILLAYETRRIDLYRGLEPEMARAVLQQQSEGKRRDFVQGDRFATFFFRVNCTREPFKNNAKLRAALSLAIDKRAICDTVLGLGESPADTFFPPGAIPLMPRSGPGGETILYEPPTGLGHDLDWDARLELARRLLDESGFGAIAATRPIEIMYAPDPRQQRRVCEAVQAMWERNLGIRVELRLQERKVLSQRVRALDYDLATSDWYGDYMDPSTFLDIFASNSGNNRTGWSNARYDELIRAAAIEPGDSKRFAMFTQAESILCRDELPLVPIYFKRGNFLMNPKFVGVRDNVLDSALIHRARRGAEGSRGRGKSWGRGEE